MLVKRSVEVSLLENNVKRYFRIMCGENETHYYITSGGYDRVFQYANENLKNWWSIDEISYEMYREAVGY